jgi:dephospho-CoA kinase
MAVEIAGKRHRPRKTISGHANIYAGLLWCADCGSAMRRQTRRNKRDPETVLVHYLCGVYSRSGKLACTTHMLSERALSEMILADIRANATLISMDEEAVRQELISRLRTQTTVSLTANRMELDGLTARIGELAKVIPSLYEDKVSGTLPESVFVTLLAKYEKERLEKSEKADSLRKKIASEEQSQADASAWIKLMKKYAHADDLSAAVLLDLVKRIEVGDATNASGEKIREVKIFYRFINSAGLAGLTPEPAEVCYDAAG